MPRVSFSDVGGAHALVIGFADPTESFELARQGLLVAAVVGKAGTVRRWRAAAKNALPPSALERLSVTAATPETLEAEPQAYARVIIGPEVEWQELPDPGAWLVHLLSPDGDLIIRTMAGPDPARRLRKLVEPLAAGFRLLAVDLDGPYLIVRAHRCAIRVGVPDPEHALAELALVMATRCGAAQELIVGLREALDARDRVVLAQRRHAGREHKRRELAALAARIDRLAIRIDGSRRAVRAEHEQLAATLASVDDVLAQRPQPASIR